MTIRIELIVEHTAEVVDVEDDERNLLSFTDGFAGDLEGNGFKVTSAVVHGGTTIPGAFQQIVPPTGPGASDAPDPGPGGIPPSQQ